MPKVLRNILVIIGINIGILIFLAFFGKLSFFERISDVVNDSLTYKLQYHQNRHSENIVILKIDDRSLDSLGKSDLGMLVFDKGSYAEAIERIFSQYQASVLGIDVVFANPSVLGRQDEQKLQTALKKYADKVVIASRNDYTPFPLCIYADARHGAINITRQEKMRFFQHASFPYNIQQKCSGFPIHSNNKESIYSLSREVLNIYKGILSPFETEKINSHLKAFDASESNISYIDYFSDGKQHEGTYGYESYSFIDILEGKSHTKTGKEINLKGKIVLLGEVGTLLHDSHYTPVHPNVKMPGIEINANIITTLEQGRHLKKASFALSLILLILVQTCIISCVLYSKTVYSSLITLGCIFCICVFGAWMFIGGEIYNIFTAIIGSILAYTTAFIYRFQISDRTKRLLKKQFSSYVSPDLVSEISKNPDSILTKGEKRDMTIFFSDIVSFTSISENTDPERMVEILNEYFSEMTQIIHKHKGTLDKYIGDAVMCFFGAPIRQENHSYYACKTALAQQKRLRELNKEWKTKGYPEIKIRIGLHSGEAVHGNIGKSDTRVNYTVIGDSVNLASRLEGICKKYGISICVSEYVYSRQKDSFHFRELDTISVKGREKAVKIYQLIAEKNLTLSEKHQEYLDRYAIALEAYKNSNFAKAYSLWSQNIGDEASHMMKERCKDIQEGKATLNQGVFKMQSK